MKPSIFALYVVLALSALSAQRPAWQPSPGHTQIPIWPGAAPDPQPVAGPEYEVFGDGMASVGGDVVKDDWDDFGVRRSGSRVRRTRYPFAIRN